MATHERQQMALAASRSLQQDLTTIRTSNAKEFSKFGKLGGGGGGGGGQGGQGNEHSKGNKKLTKKEFTQNKKMEKSYQRQRARAEEKAMRLQASKDVGMHHHHKKKKKKKQGSGASSNGFGTYQGALPTTRSHPRNGGIKAKQTQQQQQHDDANDHGLNKHRNHYSTTQSTAEMGGRGAEGGAGGDGAGGGVGPVAEEESVWIAYIDDDTHYTVYFNEVTNVSSWNPPKNGKYRWVEEPPENAKLKVNGMDDPEGLGSNWMHTNYKVRKRRTQKEKKFVLLVLESSSCF